MAAMLMHCAQTMFVSGKEVFPIERTLVASGVVRCHFNTKSIMLNEKLIIVFKMMQNSSASKQNSSFMSLKARV